jgi:hypothetical protein
MSKKQFIKGSNEAPKLYLTTYLSWFTAAYVFKAPQWVYGAIGVFALLVTIGAIYRMINEDGVDVVRRKD